MTPKRGPERSPQQPPEGAMIQEMREARGLTRAAFGRMIATSGNWIKTLETGYRTNRQPYRPGVGRYAHVFFVLGCSAEEIEERTEATGMSSVQRLRLRAIAWQVRRLAERCANPEASTPPEGMMTLDLVCVRLQSLRAQCGDDTLRAALLQLGWIVPPRDANAS